ncbi:MAG: DUF87 domain-containing protein [Desulfurococcales archaeon]|nr:DUF87 domain-containing protein [Desulfurococcales archaeon]
MQSSSTPVAGFTTSIKSYSMVEGVLLRPADAVVRYGTLVSIKDSTSGYTYLAMVSDVKEETPHPALDVERLRKLLESLMVQAARLEDALRVLDEITSPSQELVRWSSIMNVELTVLGQVVEEDGRPVLSPYDRPPRPFSRMGYPDPGWLERLLHGRFARDYKSEGLYLGRLSYNPEVGVYMVPSRLTTHLAILGQTGSGKTETVKRLVFEVSRRRSRIGYPDGGIVVFDVAGEYTGYPYTREDVVPLLDAVFNPQAHTPEPPHEKPERVTILIPYEASRGRGAGREDLLSGVAELACRLSERLGTAVDALVFTDYERLSTTAAPRCTPQSVRAGFSSVGYSWAYRLLGSSRVLVVALPLPAFMDVDSMVELSGTRSEYFPLLVTELASALDLFHGDDVYGVKLLIHVVSAWHQNPSAFTTRISQLAREPGRGGPSKHLVDAIEAHRAFCEGSVGLEATASRWAAFLYPDSTRVSHSKARDLFFTLQRYMAWLAYRYTLADPAGESERAAACKLVATDDGLDLFRSRLEGLARAVLDLSSIAPQTLTSTLNALRKIERLTSETVDTVIFDELMRRLMTGFTIIHLAPPSSGDVDVFLATLVRRLFNLHVGRFEEDRLTVIVAEEAHNLAPAGEEKATKRALLRVAREGRKWGLSLWLVTQRPAFIDAGVLSQAATSILLRTTNPDDLTTIKRGVESVAAEIVERLPDLEPTRGEALLAGLAAPERRVPLLIMVEKIPKPQKRQPP